MMISISEFLSITNQFNKLYSGSINAVAAGYGMSKVEVDVLYFFTIILSTIRPEISWSTVI